MSTKLLSMLGVAALSAASVAPAAALTVATFNIHGPAFTADQIAPTVAAVRASGADVVGLQESSGNAPAIAAALGWNFRQFASDNGDEAKNADGAILSRLPITQTLRGGVRIKVAGGREVCVFDEHAPAYPYQPYDLRDGKLKTPADAVAAAEAARGRQVDALAAQLAPYLAAKRAVFVTGDFNEPSHLDWTAAAVAAGLRPMAVAYPASTKLAAAGLTDSYRATHPDEVAHPGLTWTPEPGPGEVFDRIDFVYAAGAAPTASRIVGENAAHADVVSAPFRSDHRLVVSAFDVPDAAAAPVRIGVNLLSNGSAEANRGTAGGAARTLTDWETAGDADTADTPATAQLYGVKGYAPRPGGAGKAYFYGGQTGERAESHAVGQTVNLADLGGLIDAGHARYRLSGSFGGHLDQADAASITAAFLSASGELLQTVTIGGVTPADRHGLTQLLARDARGTLPAGARSVHFTLTFTKSAGGTFNDGSADELSFVVTDQGDGGHPK